MKSFFLLTVFFCVCIKQSTAQRKCASVQYLQLLQQKNPSLQSKRQSVEKFIQHHLQNVANARPALLIIKIPVIVHIVYHLQNENIPDEAVYKQMEALNRDYRRMNADSIKTPEYFKAAAADCKIEFELAKVDPQGRPTTGIERVYSPIKKWEIGDNVKFSSGYGADGWDPGSYLNIWVCNLEDLFGYSSVIGGPMENDGVVINYTVFNNLDDGGAFDSGRTVVHEVGHWLGLAHLWGDADCGDDYVADTPKQAGFTTGCPGGVRLSCNNTPTGNMYMNFMDYTDDPCMNLFTNGQRDRMRTLFDEGGIRNSLLYSKALGRPWVDEIPLPDETPQWLSAQLYPNPAQTEIVLDIKYEPRWIGKELIITNVNGQTMLRQTITSKVETINIGGLASGIYFLHSNLNGEKLAKKFIKM